MEFRLPEIKDKDKVISYIEDHYAHNEKSLSASNGLTSFKYEDWVKKIHNNVTIPDEVWGKSYTYFLFDNDKLVGILNIRYDLSLDLVEKYGHIGYGVRPSERQKGYATKMLKFALDECKRLGLSSVVLGCYKENVGSAKTIIKNGGKLIKEVTDIRNINNCYEINLISQYYEIKL